MKVLAIDPGYERLGIAVLEKVATNNGTQKISAAPVGPETLIYSETFQTDKKLEHADRLFLISHRISEIIAEFGPDFLAIETLFFTKNHKTALMVAEARGAILAEAKKSGLQIAELNPNEIKLAVTGYGKSDKQSIYKLVPQLIKIPPKKSVAGTASPPKKRLDDEMDAIAVGLTFFATYRNLPVALAKKKSTLIYK